MDKDYHRKMKEHYQRLLVGGASAAWLDSPHLLEHSYVIEEKDKEGRKVEFFRKHVKETLVTWRDVYVSRVYFHGLMSRMPS